MSRFNCHVCGKTFLEENWVVTSLILVKLCEDECPGVLICDKATEMPMPYKAWGSFVNLVYNHEYQQLKRTRNE